MNELQALIDVLSLGTIVYLLCDLWVWIEENWRHHADDLDSADLPDVTADWLQRIP